MTTCGCAFAGFMPISLADAAQWEVRRTPVPGILDNRVHEGRVRPGQRFVGGVRHYVRVADEVLSATRSGGRPQGDTPVAAQPFTHVGVPHAEHYRRLLRTFARAKERFIVHLRPED